MKKIYDRVSDLCSKITTQSYSTSFSLGILFLDRKFHKPIYNIYGFVRFADEIVDSFHDYDKNYLIRKFRSDTVEAIEKRISMNPILNSYQDVVHQYQIDWELTDTFLKSMEMDLTRKDFDVDTLEEYILGSAEVVGLMCLKVFTEGNEALYEELKPFAMKLGSAFQKVNFLRDLKEDYELMGRNYFPGVDFKNFSEKEKALIEKDIENEFRKALEGIRRLPVSSRRGVYLAYYYYKKLFHRIRNSPPEKITQARIRIDNLEKIGLMFQSLVRHQLNML